MFQNIRKMNEHSASLLLLLLLSTDFAFIVLDIINQALGTNSSLCNISGLCAYMLSYHLLKQFWIIILFAYLLRLTKWSGYVSWVIVFTCFLIDDALEIHQKIGDIIADTINGHLLQNLSLAPRFFELAFLAVAGLFLLAIIAWAYFHSPPTFREISNDLLLFIMALVFFGLIADVAVALKLAPTIVAGLEIVEDSGESVVYSLILWDVFLLAIRNGESDSFLHDLVCKPLTRRHT
jgi:hypothetical protein